MNFKQALLVLFTILLPSAFLPAQNVGSAEQPFYEVISDSAEIAEIRRKCFLETREGSVNASGAVKNILSLAELKALLRDTDPWKNYFGLARLKDGRVRDIQAGDAELIQLVSKFIVENDYRQAVAFEALTIVDPQYAARKIIAVIQRDEMRGDQRQNAKKLLGETEPNQATIDYLIGLLSLEKRTVFEHEENDLELSVLCALYLKSKSKLRIKIYDFLLAYNEKHPENGIFDWMLKKIWVENPEPKYLKMMEALVMEDSCKSHSHKEILIGVLELKGKSGKKLVEKLMENSDEKPNYPILAWAYAQGEIEIQERILKGYSTQAYASPKRHLRAVAEIGGYQMADKYLSYFERFEDLQTYRDFVRVQYAPIDHLNPYRQFADTLFKIGFLESPLSNQELAALRAVEYHNSENGICFCSVIESLPCFLKAGESKNDILNYIDVEMIPAANGALDGLEFLRYTSASHWYFEWLIFKGKAYRYTGEYRYFGELGSMENAYTQFHSLNFLLELHGIKERFLEIPVSVSDSYTGGLYTTPEKAHVLFSLIGREPWKQ